MPAAKPPRGGRKAAATARASAARGAEAATPARPRGTRWRAPFLAMLAETSNVSRSALAAGVTVSHAYKTRRNDANFRRAWHQALCEGYDLLELEVLGRLREGSVTCPEGGRFDFGSALRILAAHRGTVASARAVQADDDEEAVFAAIDAKIDALRRGRDQAPSGGGHDRQTEGGGHGRCGR